MKRQPKPNLPAAVRSLGIVFLIFFAMAFACKDGAKDNPSVKDNPGQQTSDVLIQPPGITEYGSRKPRECKDKTVPAKGSVTAAAATQYFICKFEKVWSNDLYLVEDVKLEVGGGVPYERNLGGFRGDRRERSALSDPRQLS